MYPAEHAQVYELNPWVQEPPCRQGEEVHSSASVSQIEPVRPDAQMHVYLSGRTRAVLDSTHVAPFMQGDEMHSFVSASQLCPSYPARQTQPKVKIESTHVAPFTHGYDAHSSTSTSQCEPAQPFAHVHEYATTHAAAVHFPSEQVDPFMHGDEEHSRMFVHFLPPFAVSYPV